MGKIKKIKPPKTPIDTTNTHGDDKKIPKVINPSTPTYETITQSKTPIDKISFEKTPKIKKTISKKEKLKQKSKAFQSKINLIKQQDKKNLTKKKKKSPVKKEQPKIKLASNLKALKDALPSLDDLLQFKSKSTDIKTGVAEYDVPKTKTQMKKESHRKKQREMLDRMKRFTDLLKDPDYKKDARQTIANHIKFSRDLSDS